MQIELAPKLRFEAAEIATEVVASLGARGGGKSNGAAVMVECLLDAGVPVIVVDYVGIWFSLRLSPDGKTPSRFKIPVLGGPHGDVALAPGAGAEMKRLPANFFDTNASIMVNLGGQSVHLKVSKCPVGYVHYSTGYTPARSYAADHPFSERHSVLYSRKKDLEERSAVARKHAYSVIYSCVTCKQLVEVWPEVEPFVSPFMKAGSPQQMALAVPVKELNRQFGLGG